MRKMRIKKLCVITGTRAEYGMLYWLMKEIEQDPEFQLQIIVTGMHLSPEFGLTYKSMEKDGFQIDAKVEMLLSSDTPIGMAKSIGLGVIGFADALERLKPDLVIILGDRFEAFAAAQASFVSQTPIAHIAGGDTTEGVLDEGFRHSITKMSQLHFVTHSISARRVRQLGEKPEHIYIVGSPGIDQIKRLTRLSRKQLEKELDFRFRKKNLLITFHPVTLDLESSDDQLEELLKALEVFCPDTGLLFTRSNADIGGRKLAERIQQFVESHPNAKQYASLGQQRYLSAVEQVDAVVGNSSSGLYEVPSFKKATVNIGNRQKGRLSASSVIHCEPTAEEIAKAIQYAFTANFSNVENPYGDGNSSRLIVAHLKKISDYKLLLQKPFYDLEL